MKNMTDSCSMAWLVLSTSSLMDDHWGVAVPQDELGSMVRRSGYKPVTLQNIMRNSANISTATTSDNVNSYSTNFRKSNSISTSSCSTVTGSRPTCYLFEYRWGDGVNHEELARIVNCYLADNKSDQTVILCDRIISPRQVKPFLTGEVTLYDAGVEEFDNIYNKPSHYSADLARQREDLVKWINNGGVLLTHDMMFNGCEAETIVFLTKYLSSRSQPRSGPTRAVSQLCIVTSDFRMKQDEIKQHFNVIDQREDQGVSQSGEEEEENKENVQITSPAQQANPSRSSQPRQVLALSLRPELTQISH